MVTNEQITYLKQRVEIFNHAESLYNMDTKLTLAPHIYGKEMDEYIEWMYDEELELPDCYQIKNEFIDKYINDKWYKNLPQIQIIQ